MNKKPSKRNGLGIPETTSQTRQPQGRLPPGGRRILVDLLTRKQVADLLQTCTHTVARYTRRGLLPAVVINRRIVRYRAQDLEQFIDSAATLHGGAQ